MGVPPPGCLSTFKRAVVETFVRSYFSLLFYLIVCRNPDQWPEITSLGSWYIKCIDESFPRVLSSVPLMCHGLSDFGSPILIYIIMKCTYDLSHVRDTVSYGSALTWTLLLSVWKQFTATQNQMNASATSGNPLQSCLVFHLILDLLQKTSFWANCNSSYDIILSYLVKNSIQRNMNRRGEKCVGARWEKSLSFTKITKEMNQLQ